MALKEEKKFRELVLKERIRGLQRDHGLSDADVRTLLDGGLRYSLESSPPQNIAGRLVYPLDYAENFIVNGRVYPHIPMAIEEPSVVPAASRAAKAAREYGGFKAFATKPISLGEIRVVGVKNTEEAKLEVLSHRKELEGRVKEVSHHGSLHNLDVKILKNTEHGTLFIVEMYINRADAQGANMINKICEALAPDIVGWVGGEAVTRMFSNRSQGLVFVQAIFDKKILAAKRKFSPEKIVENILTVQNEAWHYFNRTDTHIKGIMNGIVGVGNATGQDSRALDADVYGFAAEEAMRMRLEIPMIPLTNYVKNDDGNLVGSLVMPIAMGTVGGSVSWNPVAKINLEKILMVRNSAELICIAGSVGLANNMGAMSEIGGPGIQEGHMKLHNQMKSQ